MTVNQVDHVPNRPDWACKQCGRPWPCVTAKMNLLREFGCAHLSLRLYLAMQMHEAINDAGKLSAAQPMPDFYDRFLNWVHVAPTADSRPAQPDALGGLNDESTIV
ncbi:hypothetical protein AB0M20_09275 [Actinoplanes sp. NPDC051633]|uniref:hypothetical protein n=1 Tax=Actinoplanes sp. NPDC051633 TaxID=3155670 RepID=UPI00342A4604